MTRHAALTKAKKIDDAMLKRIVELSSDPRPERLPQMDMLREDREMDARRRAEEEFQDALFERTWSRLSPEERAIIRSQVLAKKPRYSDYRTLLDDACRKQLRRWVYEIWRVDDDDRDTI